MRKRAYLEIIDSNGEVTLHDLSSDSGITTIGRHTNNDIVLARPEVAPFHALLDHRQKPYQLIILAAEGETKLGDQVIPANTPTNLSTGDMLTLAGHTISLSADEPGSAKDSPPTLPSAQSVIGRPGATPQTSSHFSERPPDQQHKHILTTLSAREWTVEVEQEATCQVTITNSGGAAAEFVLKVAGLSPDWVTITPPHVHLAPHAQATTTIIFRPPRLPESRAGGHHLAVIVTSAIDPNQFSQLGATLVIEPYQDFRVGQPYPRRQTLSWFTQSGQVRVPITNTGNTEALFCLEGKEKTGLCRLEFEVPGEAVSRVKQTKFRLQPGETKNVSVYITPLSRRPVKLGKQVYSCIITTTISGSQQPARSVLAKVQRVPLTRAGLMTFSTICLVVLLGLVIQQIVKEAPPKFAWFQKYDQGEAGLPGLKIFVPIKATATPPPEDIIIERNTGEMTYEEIFREVAAAYDLDWRLLAAQAYEESRLDPLAIGQANEYGLMQLGPSTWEAWAPKVGVSDPFDPYSNVLVAATYLVFLRDSFSELGYREDDWMLIAYNWGPSNLYQHLEMGGKWGDIPALTRRYTSNILQATETEILSPIILDRIQTSVFVTAELRGRALRQAAQPD
jgi:membrane-bound lytic murein transglycosylase F